MVAILIRATFKVVALILFLRGRGAYLGDGTYFNVDTSKGVVHFLGGGRVPKHP